jgi:hypothetical protein
VAIASSKTIVKAVVPKTVAAALDRLARVGGKTRSAIIAEFLVEAEPQIRRIAGMLEVAKAQRGLFPKSTVAELEAALDDLSGNATEVMDRMENALQLPLEEPKQGSKRPAAAARRAARRGGRKTGRKPPPSNTGVKSR